MRQTEIREQKLNNAVPNKSMKLVSNYSYVKPFQKTLSILPPIILMANYQSRLSNA